MIENDAAENIGIKSLAYFCSWPIAGGLQSLTCKRTSVYETKEICGDPFRFYLPSSRVLEHGCLIDYLFTFFDPCALFSALFRLQLIIIYNPLFTFRAVSTLGTRLSSFIYFFFEALVPRIGGITSSHSSIPSSSDINRARPLGHRKGLVIGSLNINSLLLHIDEVRCFIKEKVFHILALNETKLDDTIC